MLDLLPHEWQVLTMIDGERDLRAIAASLGRDQFEIAKIAYGLASTGVIGVRAARAPAATPRTVMTTDARIPANTARSLAGELTMARSAVEQLLRLSPSGPFAPDAREALDALARLQRVLEGHAHG
jgi:hypothetical protein